MNRTASARWSGDLKAGTGSVRLGSGMFEGPYSFSTRFESTPGTNPEELLGASHAACFTMALAAALAKGGHAPTSIDTTATVSLEKGDAGFSIARIALVTKGVVPGVAAEEFQRLAEETKTGCIISRALSAVPMTVDAQLASA